MKWYRGTDQMQCARMNSLVVHVVSVLQLYLRLQSQRADLKLKLEGGAEGFPAICGGFSTTNHTTSALSPQHTWSLYSFDFDHHCVMAEAPDLPRRGSGVKRHSRVVSSSRSTDHNNLRGALESPFVDMLQRHWQDELPKVLLTMMSSMFHERLSIPMLTIH